MAEENDRLRENIGALELKNALLEKDLSSIDTRLASIEDTLKWLVRLVIGALIAAVITFALKGGLAGV